MAVFYSSLMCFPSMLLRYFLNDFQMLPIVPITTGITCVFTLLLLLLLLLLLILNSFISHLPHHSDVAKFVIIPK
jgi:hypothetical protein